MKILPKNQILVPSALTEVAVLRCSDEDDGSEGGEQEDAARELHCERCRWRWLRESEDFVSFAHLPTAYISPRGRLSQ